MNDLSSVQFDRGRKEGLICPRCTWTHRSDSTRLMDLGMYIRHAKTIHRLLPEQLDDFVSEAIYARRVLTNEPSTMQPYTVDGLLKYLTSPSEENSQLPPRAQSQPHPSLCGTNTSTWESQSYKAAGSDSVRTERTQVMGQSSEGYRPSETSQQDWIKTRLGGASNMSLQTASQNYRNSLQSPSVALPSTETPLATKDKNNMQATMTTRPASLAWQTIKPTNMRSCKTEYQQGKRSQRTSSAGILRSLPADTKTTIHSSGMMNPDLDNNSAEFIGQSRQERAFLSRINSNGEYTMAQKRKFAEFGVEQSNQYPRQMNESLLVGENGTSSAISTSDSSVQGSLPVTPQPELGWQEVILAEPQLTDIQYRDFLSVYVPEVKLNGMDYEGFKALFDQTQDKTAYLELARRQTHAQRTGRLQTYGQLNNLNPGLTIAAMRENEKRSNEQSYREELASLMAQRALKEQVQEEPKNYLPHNLVMGNNLLADSEPLWLGDYFDFDQFLTSTPEHD